MINTNTNYTFKEWVEKYNNDISYIYSKLLYHVSDDNIYLKNIIYNNFVNYLYLHSNKKKTRYL